MKISPLLLAFPALLPLSTFSPAADGSGERFVFRDGGRSKTFQILTDEVQSVGVKSVNKLLIGKQAGLKAVQKEAKFLESSTGSRVDLVAYEEGAPQTEANRRLVTRRVLVKLAEGVSSTLVRDAVGAVKSERFAFTEDHCVLTFNDSLSALAAVDVLRDTDGVVSADLLLAHKKEPKKLPTDPFFDPASPAGGAQRHSGQINADLFGMDPFPGDDSFSGDNISVPLFQRHLLHPPGTARAYQWYLKNEGIQVPAFLQEDCGDRLIDINVTPAWDKYLGRNVTVGVIDDGVEMRHTDFTVTNIDKINDRNVVEKGAALEDGTPPYPNTGASTDNHGTSVAGVIFGRHDNNLGVAGIAPSARLVAVRFLGGFVDDLDEAQVLALGTTYVDPTPDDGVDNGVRGGRVAFDVANNSWGPASFGAGLFPSSEIVQAAFRYGAISGRNNRGSLYVFSAGNDGDYHDNVNYSYVSNSLFTISVGGVTDIGRRVGYATTGAALAVVAPTRGDELPPRIIHPPNSAAGFPNGEPTNPLSSIPAHRAVDPEDVPSEKRRNTQAIVTFDTGAAKNGPFNRFNSDFDGTSAAAPIVTGVIALILEANPQLRWRDVQEILMRSADPVDFISPFDGDPAMNGARGFGRWVKGPLGNYVSHVYGYGVVNADRATQMAVAWTPNTKTWLNTTRTVGVTGRIVPDAPATPAAPNPGVTIQFPGPPPTMRLEHVQVRLKMEHGRRGDVGVTLISPPTGQMENSIESELYVPHREDYGENFGSLAEADVGTDAEYWTFMTRRVWGARYDNAATWQLRIWDNTTQGAVNNPKAGEILVPVGNPKQPGRLQGVSIIYHGTSGPSENEPPSLENDSFVAALDQPFRVKLATQTSDKAPVQEYFFRIVGKANPATQTDGPVDKVEDPETGEMVFPPLINPETGIISFTPKYAGAWNVEIGARTVLGTNFKTITFTVRATSTYNQWRTSFFSAAELQNPAISGEGADPDGDGIGNYLEFALNTNPKAFSPDVIETQTEDGVMTFTYRIDANALGAVQAVKAEISSDLETWTPVEATVLPPEGALLPRAVSMPIDSETRKFFRLRGANPTGS